MAEISKRLLTPECICYQMMVDSNEAAVKNGIALFTEEQMQLAHKRMMEAWEEDEPSEK